MKISKILMIFFITSIAVGCAENDRKQPNQTEPTVQNGDNELSFRRVSMNEIRDTKPKDEWSEVQSVDLGTADGEPISILLYSEDSQNAESDVHAFVQHAGKLYDMGVNSYRLSELETQKLDGSFDDVVLLAGIGTKLTYWNVVAFDKKSDKLLSFEMVGRPEMIDLDSDGYKELVASFEGAHMNFPNVEIIRSKDAEMESAKVIEAQNSEDPEYARLVKQDSNFVFEVGKVQEEQPQRFKYENGRLIII